ncbi:MAG TPA: hypothetical protein VGF85_01250 [Opitutaceae bacterium]
MKRLTSKDWFAVAVSAALLWLAAAHPCPCPAEPGACTKACCGSSHAGGVAKSCGCGAAFSIEPGVRVLARTWTAAPDPLPALSLARVFAGGGAAPRADLLFRPTSDPGPRPGFGDRFLAACLYSQAPPAA